MKKILRKGKSETLSLRTTSVYIHFGMTCEAFVNQKGRGNQLIKYSSVKNRQSSIANFLRL